MSESASNKPTRRKFLKRAALGAAGLGVAGAAGAGIYLGSVRRVSRAAGKKVIIIGIDGMDPRLSEDMMAKGELPNLAKMRAAGGFSSLGTSIPPQSPVAWANFINGAGPGSHGIFDFIHRDPAEQAKPFSSFAETLPGVGGWEVEDHKIPLDFWPYNHQPPKTVLRRQGTPFWDYLDEAGVPSTFYDLPSNYPPSPSKCGHHRCICGMGTPDMLGGYGAYTYFFWPEKAKPKVENPEKPDGDNPPPPPMMPEVAVRDPNEAGSKEGGTHVLLAFENNTATAKLVGPQNSLLKAPKPIELELKIHRDPSANAAVIEIMKERVVKKRVVLKPGQWSQWTQLDFELSTPSFMPSKTVTGICRFYLQEVAPTFRLYVSPINIDPRAPATPISEPNSFVTGVAEKLGPFYTTGFQEDAKARRNSVFNDDDFLKQATIVLEERFALWEHAIQNYDDGLLFFYFSSNDLQSHMFWWDGNDPHPLRKEPGEAAKGHGHVRHLYKQLDEKIGDLHDRYGSVATIIVMSDHGFANFGVQFNLNTWLRNWSYILPDGITSLHTQADWSRTRAYGIGINGLYLNLKGRERDGIVEPGKEAEELIEEITNRLLEATKWNDEPVIRSVYRASEVYKGDAAALAPDLIIGYHRGFRASWDTALGDMGTDALSINADPWSADHCMDALGVPGVLWCSKPIRGQNPSLVDMAPSILAEYGLPTPPTMTGKNVL